MDQLKVYLERYYSTITYFRYIHTFTSVKSFSFLYQKMILQKVLSYKNVYEHDKLRSAMVKLEAYCLDVISNVKDIALVQMA